MLVDERLRYYDTRGERGNFHTPTKYDSYRARASTNNPGWNCTGYGSAYAPSVDLQLSAAQVLVLRSKLSEALRGSAKASLALTMLDARSSLQMVIKACSSLVGAANSLRKLRFGDAFQHLQVSNYEARRFQRQWKPGKAKDFFPDLWLQVNFGWVPLLQDIHAAITVMESNPSPVRVRVSTFTEGRPSSHYNRLDFGGGFMLDEWNVMSYVRGQAGAVVKAVNPNLLLASQLGLTNPAHVAWDAVPFSFIADWFLPIGSFLKSFDDFYGIEVQNAWTTTSIKANGSCMAKGSSGGRWWPDYDYFGASTASIVHRSPTLPEMPSFLSLQPKSLNSLLWKAVTSVALLQQSLR